MPARSSTFRCHCSSCNSSCDLGPDGHPLGKELPASQRNAHLVRVKLEKEANEQARASFLADVGSSIFVTTLVDDGPAAKTQPSKLWTSRHQYQQLSSIPEVQICDPTSSVNAIMDGVQRLDTSNLSTSAVPANQVTRQPDLSDKINAPCQKPSKRERNHATKKVHCILDAASKRASACLQQLIHEPSRTGLETAEKEVTRLRSALENIKRNVPSVEQKKCSLAPLLSQLNLRIMELRSIYPQECDRPLQYNSGMFLCTILFLSLIIL